METIKIKKRKIVWLAYLPVYWDGKNYWKEPQDKELLDFFTFFENFFKVIKAICEENYSEFE